MQLAQSVEQMRRSGLRRICILAGDREFLQQKCCQWQQACPGDWVHVGPKLTQTDHSIPFNAARNLLGQEFLHAIFDATQSFHAESLAALSGTLLAGSWLVILLPHQALWGSRPDLDSVRWSDDSQPIASPIFMRHFQQHMLSDPHVVFWQQGCAPPPIDALPFGQWQTSAVGEQHHILSQLVTSKAATVVVTAPRGRGKSALGGMLANAQPGCLITAPARISTAVLARFAGQHYHFMAPDAVLAEAQPEQWQWLIVDEAAAIPSAQLQALLSLFPRCLLLTTTEGYEGTGQGFLLKLCSSLPNRQHFTLHQPLRYRADDPVEQAIARLFFFTTTPQPASPTQALTLQHYQSDQWLTQPLLATSTYQLLQMAHYRTTPLDLRRMMDAAGVGFLQLQAQQHCYAALGWQREGGLPLALAQAVWRGERRPRGNLVAQSLAAHSGFPQAMTLHSVRLHRIVVQEGLRRRGYAKYLVEQLISQQQVDYLSVSFGFTHELWAFWQHCGFQLVRIGTQQEASSGCCAAMALYPLTAAGQQLTAQARQRFERDWPWQQSRWCSEITLSTTVQYCQVFNQQDRQELIGFAQASRPLTVSYPALQRAWEQAKPDALPALAFTLSQPSGDAPPAGVSRKVWLQQLRVEAAVLLELCVSAE